MLQGTGVDTSFRFEDTERVSMITFPEKNMTLSDPEGTRQKAMTHIEILNNLSFWTVGSILSN